jgi:Tfp pilus assembly protein PilN
MEKISLDNLLGKLLSGQILYFGEEMLRIHRDGSVEKASPEDIHNARVVIVGKKHYFETIKQFPFHKLKEIKSAVLLDQEAYTPFPTTRCYIRKLQQTGEGVRVNLWFISPEAVNMLEKQFLSLAIPETALLSFHSRQITQIYEIDLAGKYLLSWVGKIGDVQSLTSDNNELDGFRRAIGKDAMSCPVVRIAGLGDYAVFLSGIIQDLSFKWVVPFVNFNLYSVALDPRQLKRGLLGMAGSFLLYMLLSVAIPYSVEKKLEKEDLAVSASSIELVEKQNQMDVAMKKQKILADPIGAYNSKYILMTVLREVLPAEARVSLLTISDNRVEIRGTTPSATNLLTALSDTKGIQNAQFAAPVRKDNKTSQDTFVLSFGFTGKNLPQSSVPDGSQGIKD